jgi:release factor glutamine methyltransferase
MTPGVPGLRGGSQAADRPDPELASGAADGPNASDSGLTWRQMATSAAARLRAAAQGNASQEARWLVEHAGGLSAVGLQLVFDRPAPADAVTALAPLLERRLRGEPLQYVLGRWSFRSLDLAVDRRVLIPRPETEMLVEAALAEIDRLGATTAVDLGTGSGAIALSLLVERPRLDVWATDASADALAVARTNLDALGEASVRGHLVEGPWFEALPDALRGTIDVVVSNPPYVAAGEMADLSPQVRDWEPHQALAAGPEGLDALAAIVAVAPGWLARPGALLCEMAPHQARAVTVMAAEAGFTSVSVWPDLAGRDRILHARL